jgi:hypothetical protein
MRDKPISDLRRRMIHVLPDGFQAVRPSPAENLDHNPRIAFNPQFSPCP